jgi:hypothetical protein
MPPGWWSRLDLLDRDLCRLLNRLCPFFDFRLRVPPLHFDLILVALHDSDAGAHGQNQIRAWTLETGNKTTRHCGVGAIVRRSTGARIASEMSLVDQVLRLRCVIHYSLTVSIDSKKRIADCARPTSGSTNCFSCASRTKSAHDLCPPTHSPTASQRCTARGDAASYFLRDLGLLLVLFGKVLPSDPP